MTVTGVQSINRFSVTQTQTFRLTPSNSNSTDAPYSHCH
jgi:hypothetical protein